ncbi:MAG: STAS domain-containing protein [Planctomycetes bacterium]|nr:STAS domain-containing protein [Planctomycetota bacterium]
MSEAPPTPQPQPSVDRIVIFREEGVTRMSFPRDNVDGTTVREMYEMTAWLMDEDNLKLLIDFTDIPLVTSGAMGMLVTMRKKLMSTGGQMHVAIPNEMVLGSFKIMKLDIVLHLFDSVEAARGAFKA